MSKQPRSLGLQPDASTNSLATQRAQGRTKLQGTGSSAGRCRRSIPGYPDPSTQTELNDATDVSADCITRANANNVIDGINERDSSANTMDNLYVSDDEFHIPFLPVLSPRCVTISHRHILGLALKKLGLIIEDTKVIDAGDGELYASVSFHLSADKGRRALEPKVFHGDFAGTKEKAIESASSAALTFLKYKSMIYVDDANYHELKACQHKLLAASSWAMLFQDRAVDLQKKMSKLTGEACGVEKEIDVSSDDEDTNDTCLLALANMQGTTSQQATPPPKLDNASKQTGKRDVCIARRGLFGKRKRDDAA